MDYIIVEYNNEFGENPLTDIMKAELKGLSIDEQIDYFELKVDDYEESYSYGECDRSYHNTSTVTLRSKMTSKSYTPLVTGLIVSNGIIVGCVFKSKNYCLLNETCCTYFACDDDGVGSSEASTYHTPLYKGKR